VESQNIFDGRNNMTCSTNCKYRTAATLCTIETRVFQVYNCKYLHKGDNTIDDDDYDNNNNFVFRLIFIKFFSTSRSGVSVSSCLCICFTCSS